MKHLLFTLAVVLLTTACKTNEIVPEIKADFSYEQEDDIIEGADDGYYVQFKNLSENFDYCEWDFGDGETLSSSGTYIEHVYDYIGLYTVKLRAFKNNGDNHTTTIDVVVIGSEIKTFCVFEDTEGQCYVYTAKLYDDQNCYEYDQCSIEIIESDINGNVIFRHLDPGKLYYIKIYKEAITGSGYYDNTEYDFTCIPEYNKQINFETSLKYYP